MGRGSILYKTLLAMKILFAFVSTLLALTVNAQDKSDSIRVADSIRIDYGDQIFLNVEEPAMPVGGYPAFYEYMV